MQLGLSAAIVAACAALALVLGLAVAARRAQAAEAAESALPGDDGGRALRRAVEALRDELRLRPADGFYLSGEAGSRKDGGVKEVIRQVRGIMMSEVYRGSPVLRHGIVSIVRG